MNVALQTIFAFLLVLMLQPSCPPVAAAENDQAAAVDWTEIAFEKARVLGGHADQEEGLKLVNRLLDLGHVDSAGEVLEYITSGKQPEPTHVSLTRLRLQTATYFSVDKQPALKEEIKKTIQTLLFKLAQTEDLSPPQLRFLEQQAEQFDQKPAVVILAEKLALTDPETASLWWFKAGEWSLAAGNPEKAIRFFQTAEETAASDRQRYKTMTARLRAMYLDNRKEQISMELETMLSAAPTALPLEDLARFCLEIERPDLAWKLYGRLYLHKPQSRDTWLAQLEKWALAAGQARAASQFLQDAPEEKLSGEQQLQLLGARLTLAANAGEKQALSDCVTEILAVPQADADFLEQAVQAAARAGSPAEALLLNERLLEESPGDKTLLNRKLELALACGAQEKALDAVQNLIALSADDPELLETGASLALSVGKPDLAAEWNEQLLAAAPEDTRLLEKQADIALAAGDPQTSVQFLRELYRQDPTNPDTVIKLAKAEEWSGNLPEAMTHWRRLLSKDNSEEASEQLLRLALAVNDYPLGIQALQALSSCRPLTPGEAVQNLLLLEHLGMPDKAAASAEKYLQQFPAAHGVRRELAHLLMRAGDYAHALAIWEEIASRLGRNNDETLFRAECYWRLNKKDEAFAVVQNGTQYINGADNWFHAGLLAELAWLYRKPELTRYSIAYLIENYDKEHFAQLERIIAVQRESGNLQQAVETARLAALKSADPRFSLLRLQLAETAGNEQLVSELLDKMQTTPEQYSADLSYRIIRAGQHYRHGEFAEAKVQYIQALSLEAESLTAKEGLLWTLLALGEKQAIADRLDSWQEDALSHHELHLVFALCSQSLGEYRQAGAWFELLIEQEDAGYGILLGYADVLDECGAVDRAYRLRQYALLQLRKEAVEFLADQRNLTETVQNYIRLIHRYGGVREGEYWTEVLKEHLQKTQDSQHIREMILSWHLNRKLPDQARIWMSGVHENRITTPQWVEILFALENQDTTAMETLLAASPEMNRENRIALLQKLGRRREALQLAEQGIDTKQGLSERTFSRMAAASLSQEFPQYWTAGGSSRFSDGLDSVTMQMDGMYSPLDMPLSFGAKYRHYDFSSSVYQLDGRSSADDLALSVHLGNGTNGGSLVIGGNFQETDNIGYTTLAYHHTLGEHSTGKVELALHSVPDIESILRPAALQNRMDFSLTGTLAGTYYYLVDLWGRQYMSRENDEIAKGYGSTAEFGLRHKLGAFEWQAGIQGNFEKISTEQHPTI